MEQISMFSSDEKSLTEQVLTNIENILKSEDRTELKLKFSQSDDYDLIGFEEKPIDFRVKFGKKISYLSVRLYCKKILEKYGIECKQERSIPWVRLALSEPKEIYKYKPLILEIYDKRLAELPDGFDCCSLFVACSDAGECVQPLKDIYKECRYRIKLKNGIIFHGKNRTIKG